jgi:hypothetical protein
MIADVVTNICTMHNDTYFVHKRGLVLWRARLLYFEAFLMSILLQRLMPTAAFSPSWRAGSPDSPGFQDGFLFPRVHTHLLHTVRYKKFVVENM